MPRIRNLPEAIRIGLKNIVAVDDESFRELLLSLQDIRPAIMSPDYLSRLTPNIAVMPQQKASEIVEAAYLMSTTYVVNNVSIPQFADDIADALERGVVKDISITPETRQRIVERLTALLNLAVFKIGAKATNVLHEHEHILTGARIMTDIRPIFDDNLVNTPIGVILVNTLKIEYREGGEPKEFFVAMDTRDVQLLMDVLERAKSKVEELKSLLSVTQIHHIDFD